MTPAGRPVPTALASYYRDLDAGRMASAAERFSQDAIYETAQAGGAGAPSPPFATHGRAALRARFEQRGQTTFQHDLQLCLGRENRCIVEGVGRSSETQRPLSTFVALAVLDADGLVAHYLAYGCALVWEDGAAAAAVARDDPGAARAIRRFLASAPGAARSAMLTADAHFSSTTSTGERVDVRGRARVEKAWARHRELEPAEHLVDGLYLQGSRALVDGRATGRTHPHFIASVGTDGAGGINRYIEYHCPVPRDAFQPHQTSPARVVHTARSRPDQRP